MVEFCGETLFETRVTWRRIGATNIASNNLRRLAQFLQRPLTICNREAPRLPIRHRLARIETIKIDCDVNIFPACCLQKLLKVLAPIIAQYRAAAFSMFIPWLKIDPRKIENAAARYCAIIGASTLSNFCKQQAGKMFTSQSILIVSMRARR